MLRNLAFNIQGHAGKGVVEEKEASIEVSPPPSPPKPEEVKEAQKLMVDFAEYPSVLTRMLDTCIREPHSHQRMELRTRLGVSHPKLLAVIADMEDNIEEPLSQTELADMAALSTRQLERLFRNHLSATMRESYMRIRLEKSEQLLRTTALSKLKWTTPDPSVADLFRREALVRFLRAKSRQDAKIRVSLAAKMSALHTHLLERERHHID